MPSKLGMHVQHVVNGDAMLEIVRLTQPGVLKNMDDVPAFMHGVKRVSPGTLRIGRAHTNDQDMSDPEARAREQFERIMTRADRDEYDAWEGLNETARDSEDIWRCIGRFDTEFARLMHAQGLKTVALQAGVGHPTEHVFVRLPEVVEGCALADYIGVHEYCAPRMDSEFLLNPDNPDIQPEVGGYFTLRYRKWYPFLPPEARKPLIISECGIDSGACHWDPGAQGGWQSFTTANEYVNTQLRWYDLELRKDPFVAGATPFLWGTRDEDNWGSFDLFDPKEARDAYTAYIISQHGVDGDGEWDAQYAARLADNLDRAQELVDLFSRRPSCPPTGEAVDLIEAGQADINQGQADISKAVALLK